MKKLIITLLITCLLVPSIVLSVDTSENSNTWLMLGGNSKHTSHSNATLTPQIGWNTPTNWQYDLKINDNESVIWSSPVSDGKDIYISYAKYYQGSNSYNESGILKIDIENDKLFGKVDKNQKYNLSALGVSNQVIPTPALFVEESGTSVVFVDSIGNIFMEGKRRKNKKTDGKPIVSSPIIFDEKIFCGTGDGSVISLSIEDWQVQEFEDEEMGKVIGSTAISGDILTFGDDKGNIFLYDRKSGKFLGRTHPVDENITLYTPTIVEGNGKTFAVYGGTFGYIHIVSLNKDATCGKCKSKKITESTFHSAPTVAGPYAYIGDEDGYLYKISLETLEVVRKLKLDYPIKSQPVLCNGFLYITTKDIAGNNGSLYIINLKTFEQFKYFRRKAGRHIINGSTSSPLIIGDYLFVPSADGKIHRFEGQRPKLKVSTEKIDFGRVATDTRLKMQKLTISNDGGGLNSLTGTISSSKAWLVCTPKIFELGKDGSVEILISIIPKLIPLGKNNEEITIISNFGTAIIEVLINIIDPPGDIEVSIDEINFGEVIKGGKKSTTFTISLKDNYKGAMVYLETKEEDNWINLSRTELDLDNITSMNVIASVNTSSTPVGKHQTEIHIWKDEKKGEPSFIIPVDMAVTERPAKPETKDDISEIVIENCISNKIFKTEFSIYNDETVGDRKPLEFDGILTIEPTYKWFSSTAEFTGVTHNKITITCSVDTEVANFWPGEKYSISISTVVNDKTFTFVVDITTTKLETCEIAFVIDSNTFAVNGREQEVIPAPFISDNGNTMVPIRFIADPLERFFGASIEWIGDIRTVLFTLGDTTLRLVIDYDQAILELPDGSIETRPMNSPAVIVEGRTFLPPRTIAEAFGAEVKWFGTERKAIFTFSKP